MSQLEQFGTYTKEAAAKGQQSEATTGWLKMQNGTNIVRLLPPLKGMDEPWITIFQHFIKVPGGSQIVFNCPRRMENLPCPACEKGDRLKQAGDAASEKMAKEFWSSQRNIAFALNRDDPDAGVQMFPFGTTIKKRLRHFVMKLGKNYTDFKDGFDIVIERTGQGLDTEYQSDLGEQCAITDSKKQLEDWVTELPDLNSFAKVLSYDEIMQKFAAVSGQPSPARKAVTSATVDADLGETAADDDDGDAF